jgi:hypothetical protein
MPRKKKDINATSVLAEIDRVLVTSKFYRSRESGKRFYDHLKLPSILSAYVTQNGQAIRANALRFGMSADTLKSIMAGGPLSENMLFRIRSALAAESASASVFPGDWRHANSAKVSAAIADVSDKLVFLKRVILSSNFLSSDDSPIDKIQILQLIALLTATLEALRAPFLDKKQTSGFFRWLAKFAKTSAQKGLEKIVVDAMGDAATAGSDLVHHLSTQPSVTDLGNILT